MSRQEIGWRAAWTGFGVTYGLLLVLSGLCPLLSPLAFLCGIGTGAVLWMRDCRRFEIAAAVRDGTERFDLLIEALDCDWDARVSQAAAEQLIVRLPTIAAEEAGTLDEPQWTRLRSLLSVRSAHSHPELAISVLAAVRRAEQLRALPRVDHLARLEVRHLETMKRVQREAEGCRLILMERLERERVGRNLLRAAGRPDRDLLRPTQQTADGDLLRLLRSTDSEGGTG